MKTLRVLLLALTPAAIAWAQPSITTTSLPSGNVSVPYSASFTCSSCTGFTWSVASGFPPGLSVNASTGAITGTPTSSGFYGFTVTLNTGNAPVTKNLSISIGAAPFSITTTSLPSGTVGTFYSQAISATGGFTPYFFSIAAGSLPAGLGISSGGTISGTPTTATSGAAFTVQGNDSSGQQAQANLIIAIAPAAAPPAITTTSLPNGTVNVAYSGQLTCSSCAGYTWAISGFLPGLSVNASTGAITGSPTSSGFYAFTAELVINNVVATSKNLSITINNTPFTITTTSLPSGTVGVFYSQAISATGGFMPYFFSITAGSLPAGLGISSGGTISGTPTTATSGSGAAFTVHGTDSSGQQANANLIIAIAPAAVPTINTTALPNGTLNQPYSAQLTCSNCAADTWAVSGNFPPGLGLNTQTGALTGSPTSVGPYSFQVSLIGPSGSTVATAGLSIIVNGPGPAITTTSLPAGMINQPYAAQLTCSNCANLSWAVTNGSLPPGIGVNAQNGALSGTPTSIGAFSFQMSLIGGTGVVASASLSITISGPSAIITTTTLSNGVIGQGYSTQLICSNCTGWTWSVTSGSLPNGLNFSSGGGISGTPSILGNFQFQVTLTPPPGLDRTFTPVSTNLSITIVAANLGIVQNNLPVAFQNVAYTTTLTGIGGTPPYTWALQSTANDGLTIGLNTGILSGTPTVAGTFSINVQITDSSGLTALKGFGLTVAVSLSVLTSSFPNGSIGVVYPLQTLQAGGGQPPYRWTITKGTLPPGITLDGIFGRISGTPTTGGAYPFTLMVTDNQANTATADLSITVGAAVTITITPASLPGGTVGTAYSQSLTATGGTGPYTFAVTTGTLPAGLTLSSGGAISGTPTAAATSNFTVTATDANQATGTAALSIVVAAKPAITITTTSLPGGTVAKAYSQTLAATGGQTPYTWSVTGSLPAGLTLNASTGAITGTPTAAATSNFTVTVTDANKLTAQQALSIVVSAAVAPLTVTPTTLPAAVVNVLYTQKLTAAGGVAPYTFALTLGNLPTGFTFNAGTISGTAPAAESGNFTITVTDSVGTKLDVPLSLTANNPPPPTVTLALTFPGTATSGFVQQPAVTITTGTAYPVDINGSISLTFAPSVTPSTGVDDAMIQLMSSSSSGRVINFTIPAGSKTPTSTITCPNNNVGVACVMTGTTAGTITITVDLTANGVDLGKTSKTIVNAPGPPSISNVSFQQTPGGVTVTVVGFSSTRDMISGLFHFAPATGVTFTQQDVTVQLASAFSTWWGNTAQSNPYGTQFTLTVPFTLSTQSTSVVAVTVTLTNTKGAGNPVSSQ